MSDNAAKKLRALLGTARQAAVSSVAPVVRKRKPAGNSGSAPVMRSRLVADLAAETDPRRVQSILDQVGAPDTLDRAIAAVSPGWAVKRARARTVLAASQYRSAVVTAMRPDWISFGMGSGATPPSYERNILVARSRDANRNDPVASGATETMRVNIVGSGLRPQSRIRARYLGVSEERADLLRRQAELAFAKFSQFASADNRLSFDELQFIALGKIVEDGETIAIPTWGTETWRPYGRCVELLESERLTAAGKATDGIEFGPRGEPLRYHVRKANSMEAVPIAARDDQGRPKILHVFPTKRPGQTRGIPFFAPVLSYFKDMADYLEAAVVGARVAACLSVFITRNDPQAPWGPGETTSDTVSELSPGQVARLNVGESINVVDPKQPGETFGPFMETVLRIIGVSLGLPYELLVKDFSKTNYSSARAALLEGRRVFTTWRHWFGARFCQPIWDLVLEEAFLRGEFEAPDFYAQRLEYCRAQWIGGGWGWVDPVKEVEASRKAIDYGLSTWAEEAAAQGRDWEEIADQRERERLRETGLVIRTTGGDSGRRDPQEE